MMASIAALRMAVPYVCRDLRAGTRTAWMAKVARGLTDGVVSRPSLHGAAEKLAAKKLQRRTHVLVGSESFPGARL